MTEKSTQIIVRLSGGLGNQLFQLSTALYIAEKVDKAEIKLDLRYLKKYQTPRAFELDFLLKYFPSVSFNNPNLGFWGIISKTRLARIFNTQLFGFGLIGDSEGVSRINFSSIKILILDGYFQDPKFLMSQPLKESLFQKLKVDFKYIKDKASEAAVDKKVSIHIRRGDYVSSPVTSEFLTIELDYYRKAIKKFPKDTAFYIFGDDQELITRFAKEIKAVDVPALKLTLQEEFFLMADSIGYIIANSTFSWWAAFLGFSKEKRVISPSKWFVNKARNEANILLLDYFELV
jgi:hypothetical protein